MPKFYNPLIEEYVNVDDPEFGLQSLEDVDLERSFTPDEVELTKQTIQSQRIPEIDEDTKKRIGDIFQQYGKSPSPIEVFQLLKERKQNQLAHSGGENGFITNSDINQFKVKDHPLPTELETQLPIDNKIRPSMKPYWETREQNKVDDRNKELIKNMFNFDNLKSKLRK